MNIRSGETKRKLIQRLRKIEGQVRGVQAMLEGERDCRDIMQQLTAISSAVTSASRVFFRDYAALCLAEMEGDAPADPAQRARREQIVGEMIALLDKTP